MLSSSADNTAKMWDIGTCSLLRTFADAGRPPLQTGWPRLTLATANIDLGDILTRTRKVARDGLPVEE